MTYIVRFGVTAEWFAAAPDDRCNRTGPAITQVPHPVFRAAGVGGNNMMPYWTDDFRKGSVNYESLASVSE